MDLSFPRFDRAAELVVWPGDLAALMIGVAARQGASPTACVQGRLAPIPADEGPVDGVAALYAPADGAFHGGVAASLARWRKEAICPAKE